jgi:hypothetical protein
VWYYIRRKKFGGSGQMQSANETRKLSHEIRKIFTDLETLTVDRCNKTVREAAKMGSTSCDFKIPSAEIGMPTYNPHALVKPLENTLRKAGYSVITNGYTLSISW